MTLLQEPKAKSSGWRSEGVQVNEKKEKQKDVKRSNARKER